VIIPNTLTVGVPKVPKGCSEGFCHFWHLLTLGFRETHGYILNVGETTIEGEPQERTLWLAALINLVTVCARYTHRRKGLAFAIVSN